MIVIDLINTQKNFSSEQIFEFRGGGSPPPPHWKWQNKICELHIFVFSLNFSQSNIH